MVFTLLCLVGVSMLLILGGVRADLVLVGGGLADDNAAIYGRIVELAGGEGKARIGIITTASSDPQESADFYTDLFVNTYGASSATWIPVTESSGNADSLEIRELVEAQSGLFFGGGDQARIISAWRRDDGSDTEGLLGMRDLLSNGGVVAGTSAGAACQGSGPMIEGGLSYQALRYGAFPGGYNPDYPDDLAYNENGGLANLMGYIVDTHYSPRGREGRLIELVLDTMTSSPSTQVAMGLDENTGVHIKEDGTAEVLGSEGGIMIVDLGEVEDLTDKYTVFNNARLSFFTEGDMFNLYHEGYTIANWKTNIAGQEWYETADTSTNIFSSPDKPDREYSVFRSIASGFWDSKNDTCINTSYERHPEFVVSMRKADGVGYGGDRPGTRDFVVSYYRMALDINYKE